MTSYVTYRKSQNQYKTQHKELAVDIIKQQFPEIQNKLETLNDEHKNKRTNRTHWIWRQQLKEKKIKSCCKSTDLQQQFSDMCTWHINNNFQTCTLIGPFLLYYLLEAGGKPRSLSLGVSICDVYVKLLLLRVWCCASWT